MIRKQLRIGLLAALLVVSVIGAGTVTSNVLAADSSDNGDSRANATPIDTGSTVHGTIESSNDSEWYAVNLQAGQGFTIEAKDLHRVEPTDELVFDVYDPGGDEIGEMPFDAPVNAYRTSAASTSVYGGDAAEQTGTYYIRASGPREGHTGGVPGNYSLIVNTHELDEHDPNEQPDTAIPIESGDTVSGLLTGYDRDIYAIELERGEIATVTSDGFPLWVAGPTVPSAMPGLYGFGDHTIHRTATQPGAGNNSLTFTANRIGTYYLMKVFPTEDSGIGTFWQNGSYEMSVHVSDQDESPDQPADNGSDTDSEPDEGASETPNETDAKDSTEKNPPTETDDSEQPETDTGEKTDDANSTNQDEQTASDDSDQADAGEETATTDMTDTDCDDDETASNESDCPDATDDSSGQTDCEGTDG